MTDELVHVELATREIALEDHRASLEDAHARLGFQVEFAQSALKNLHLANGGAVLALLTFFGNTQAAFDHRAIWWAFVWFALGLFSSLAAYFGAYFSQAHFMFVSMLEAWNAQLRARGYQGPHDFGHNFRVGNIYMYFGIVAAVLSLISFVTGAFVALSGLK